MSNRGVYSNAPGSGDTSGFRKTWDKDEYAQRAAVREAKERAESKARYEAKLLGKKYDPKLEELPSDEKMLEARRERINLQENLNKTTLVPAGSTGTRRGKGAGYYCEACDLNYKNSLEWVEHLNSFDHLRRTGQSGTVERATLMQVRERLQWLKRKKDEAEKENFDLKERVEARRKIEEKEAEEKKERKKIKRETQKAKKLEAKSLEQQKQKQDADGDVDMDGDAAVMARMMGFGGFGTTKAK